VARGGQGFSAGNIAGLIFFNETRVDVLRGQAAFKALRKGTVTLVSP